MAKKVFMTAALLAAMFVNCQAQLAPLQEKKFNHYIGVQANQLIKQIINLNSSTATFDNPYLLVYSFNIINTGWGIEAGAGYNYQDVVDKLPVSKESKINNLFYRIGVCRKFMIGKRFQAGYGFDLVGDYQLNKTTSSSVTGSGTFIDSSFSSVTTKTTSIGAGPQFYLGYHFSERLILGTETSYYYTKSKEKENDLATDKITDQFNGNSTSTSDNNIEKTVTKFSFSFPVAVFLIMKF